MPLFRGTVIDVEKLQEKLDKSEKVSIITTWCLWISFTHIKSQVRAATDSKLIELQKKFSSLKETNERGEKSREKLSGELKDMKKKVTKTKMSKVPLILPTQARGLEDDLASQSKEASKYLSALTDVYNKVIIVQYFPTDAEAMYFKQQLWLLGDAYCEAS